MLMERKKALSKVVVIPAGMGIVAVALIWIAEAFGARHISDIEATLIGTATGIGMVVANKIPRN